MCVHVCFREYSHTLFQKWRADPRAHHNTASDLLRAAVRERERRGGGGGREGEKRVSVCVCVYVRVIERAREGERKKKKKAILRAHDAFVWLIQHPDDTAKIRS